LLVFTFKFLFKFEIEKINNLLEENNKFLLQYNNVNIISKQDENNALLNSTNSNCTKQILDLLNLISENKFDETDDLFENHYRLLLETSER